ncbi:unnamed protein product [Adineta steineri]|uniref:Uncharacterized protein n=1 Tax=Adineta steineri TaxID=433720 RepID=A0A816DXS7_9BILA|nr:unnamed protein product [Adineta steineri]CAF1639588.1 unnamed protein product [Adineta steineri]
MHINICLVSPVVVGSTAPDIMLSEIILILFVLAIWLSAIGFCLNQYKSLRRLETQAHYCIDRKDPLNIGDIKIVAREQDSIIYKKKRYSTLLDPNLTHPNLQAMHYVQQYLPKRPITTTAPTLSALVIDENDLTCKIPLSATTGFHSSLHTPLNTHDEETEYETLIPNSKINTESSIYNRNISNSAHKEHARHSTALTIPCISIANSLHSSWNTSQMYDASCSAQLLSVPINSLRANRHSDGNISLPVPHMNQNNPQHFNEQLLDPRLIPDTVRRSLLALHRESQENINLFKRKDKTQSENDVHGALTPWKMKMISKLKHTHPQLEQTSRPHANTLSILPYRLHYNNYDRYPLENIPSVNNEYQNTRSIQQHYSVSTTPSIRRSLKNYPKFSTQSTSESEGTQGELATFTSFYIPTNDDKLTETIIELTEKTP